MTEFHKEVKKRLIDMEKSQRWLTDEVNHRLGISTDHSYVNRVIRDISKSDRIRKTICEILNIAS